MPLDQLEKGVNIKGLVLPETSKTESFDIFEEITPKDMQNLRSAFDSQLQNESRNFIATGSTLKIFDPDISFSDDEKAIKRVAEPFLASRLEDGLWFDGGVLLMNLKQMGMSDLVNKYKTDQEARGLIGELGQKSELTWAFSRLLTACKVLGVLDQYPLINPDEVKSALLIKAEDSKRNEDIIGFFSRVAAARIVFPDVAGNMTGIDWNGIKSTINNYRRDSISDEAFTQYLTYTAIATADKVAVTDRGIELTRRPREFQAPPSPHLPQRRRF